MRTVDVHRTYSIVETGWTTAVRTGDGREEVRPVYVIPGLKERPSSPYLTTVQEARDYIDEELAGREAMREASTATFEAQARARGNSTVVVIPFRVVRALGIEAGDGLEVSVRIRRARRGAGKKVPARSCAPPHGVPGRTVDAPGRTRRVEDGAEPLIEQGRAGHGKAREVARRGVDGGGAWMKCHSALPSAPLDAERMAGPRPRIKGRRMSLSLYVWSAESGSRAEGCRAPGPKVGCYCIKLGL